MIKYGEETYSMSVVELKGNIFRAYRRNYPEEVEDLLIAVRLKPRVAAKLREYMYRVKSALEISLLWFELERATVFMTPKGADIKFWKLDLDEPDKRQKKPINFLSRLKPRLFS